jgi:hypothetical protein
VIALLVLAVAAASASAASTPKPAPKLPPTTVKPPNSAGPLIWTAPTELVAQPIDDITCPSVTLCVGIDRSGSVLWSTDPVGGPGTWQSADVDSSNELTGISCPATTLCVAVDSAGNVITSPSPTGAGSWTVAKVDPNKTANNTDSGGAVLMRGVACPSTGLCVAVDAAGNALISTDPTGGPTAWADDHIDNNATLGCTGGGITCQPPVVGIACPAITLCVAIDFSGNILTSTDPAAVGPWVSTPTDGGGLSSLWGISCPTVGFCETVDGAQRRAISFNPANPGGQYQRLLADSLYGVWCESQTLCLSSVETPGGISGLIGSFNPSTAAPTWSFSSLGGVNTVACISAALCVAGDDEGDIAMGATTTTLSAGLKTQLLSTRHLPTIARLLKTGVDKLTFTAPIAATLTLNWTIKGTTALPVTLATASVSYVTPGAKPVTLALTPAGRAVLKGLTRRITVTATATFTAGTGSVSAVRKLTLLHPPKPAKKH